MGKLLIVTHGEDVDGIVSAVLLKTYYGVCDIIFVANKEQQIVFKKLASGKYGFQLTTLIVADLSLKSSLLSDVKVVLSRLFGIPGFHCCVWFDHHTDVHEVEFRMLGGDFVFGGNNKCASQLICDKFFRDDCLENNYVQQLAFMAQVNDYPKTKASENVITVGRNLQQAITCLNFLNDKSALTNLVDKLVYNNNWQGEINRILLANWAIIKRAEDDLWKSQMIISVLGFSFIAFYVHPILPQKEIMRLMCEKYHNQADGYLAFFGDPVNNVMFFKDPVRNSFNAEDFCVFMNGGGRDGDGGYSLDFPLTLESFLMAVSNFEYKIGEFFEIYHFQVKCK